MVFNKDKHEREFLALIVHLKVEAVIGLTKILSVKVSDVDKETGKITRRDAEEIIDDLVVAFRKLPHKGRKVILTAMHKEINKNGATTKD